MFNPKKQKWVLREKILNGFTFSILSLNTSKYQFYRTTTKGPNWHSCLESLPTMPFTYKAWVWMIHQMSLHRHKERIIIVCPPPWLTDFQCGHLYWFFNFSCNRPLLCNGIVGRDTREPMSLRFFYRGTAELYQSQTPKNALSGKIVMPRGLYCPTWDISLKWTLNYFINSWHSGLRVSSAVKNEKGILCHAFYRKLTWKLTRKGNCP